MFRMNHFIRLFLSGVLLLTFSGLFGQEQEDRLLQLMKQELKYNMEELKKQESAPYYMNLRVMADFLIRLVALAAQDDHIVLLRQLHRPANGRNAALKDRKSVV